MAIKCGKTIYFFKLERLTSRTSNQQRQSHYLKLKTISTITTTKITTAPGEIPGADFFIPLYPPELHIRSYISSARLDHLNIVGEMAVAIGHELRNPMTTVRGYLQMFQNKQEYVTQREQFSIMIEELDRANIIISDFLSLAKNKAVKMKKQPKHCNTFACAANPG